MSSPPRPFDSKTVRDAHDRAVGRVVGSEISPETDETTALLVEIDADEESTMWVPVQAVSSIRRDAIQLETSMAEMIGRKAAERAKENRLATGPE